MKIETISIPGIGKKNEDCLLICDLSNDCKLAIITDGMGGLSKGDIAAKIVVDVVAEFIEKTKIYSHPRIYYVKHLIQPIVSLRLKALN